MHSPTSQKSNSSNKLLTFKINPTKNLQQMSEMVIYSNSHGRKQYFLESKTIYRIYLHLKQVDTDSRHWQIWKINIVQNSKLHYVKSTNGTDRTKVTQLSYKTIQEWSKCPFISPWNPEIVNCKRPVTSILKLHLELWGEKSTLIRKKQILSWQ